ncbi:MAG TPA: SRPBCC family protein [Terracidiphilus sp.]|jgi:hypothetical protein|nr:SRPBCC family protein [Terracidiphilus sp.]
MSSFRYAVEIFASPERVWEVLLEVERWPEWTPTVTRVARLDAGPLALGSRTRVWQPRLMTNVWRVSALDPQARIFVWETSRPGIRVIARHHAHLAPGGSTHLTLELIYKGILGMLMAVQLKHLNWEYLTQEAQGIKAFCEQY